MSPAPPRTARHELAFVPVRLLTDRTLSRSDIVVALALGMRVDGPSNVARVTTGGLARTCGLSLRAAHHSMHKLVAAGWVRVDPDTAPGRPKAVTLAWHPPVPASGSQQEGGA